MFEAAYEFLQRKISLITAASRSSGTLLLSASGCTPETCLNFYDNQKQIS